jgi:Escherichia/Staphylococcus phage prohead protease
MSKTYGAVVELQLKDSGGAERTIRGYGSTFGNVDAYGDVIVAGAFDQSKRHPVMLFQHDANEVIGRWDVVRSDSRGLWLEGRVADTPRGNEVYTLLKMNALRGLSIGFRMQASKPNKTGGRDITAAEVWEVSVVAFPANELAGVTAVRSQTAPTLPAHHLGALDHLVNESLPRTISNRDGLSTWQMAKAVEVTTHLLPLARRGDLSEEQVAQVSKLFALIDAARKTGARRAMEEAWNPKPPVTKDGYLTPAGQQFFAEFVHSAAQPQRSW